MPIRLLIADDDALIREGLSILLSLDPDLEVAAVVSDGQAAIDACIAHGNIDVILLDIRMPVMDGLAAARILAGDMGLRVLMLTTFDEEDSVRQAIQYGVKGYLLKNSPPDRIRAAIRMVHAGGSVLQDEVLGRLRDSLMKPDPALDATPFTERELEVLDLVAAGHSNREIAARLFLSEGTVKNHVTVLLGKTGCEHRTQLAIWRLQRRRSP